MEFQNCKLERKLEAQSPLIHFQAEQVGAVLRASEVKPKLDRFLLDKCRKRGEEYPEIFQEKKDCKALKYKLQIEADGAAEIVNLDNYRNFFGNQGKKNEEDKIKGIFCNIKVTILCFVPSLQKLLEKYLEEFFLVTNFGTMQGKGFGSFAPAGYDMKDRELQKRIAGYLKETTGSRDCYMMVPGKYSQERDLLCQNNFNEIQTFYGIMKSGRNITYKSGKTSYVRSYLYQYLHKKGIDNEKAWMKQNKISPAIGVNAGNKREEVKNPRYTRAVLGTTEGIRYKTDVKKPIQVKIAHEHGQKLEIERVSSPIFFKVIKNAVFIVTYPVPDELFDQKFVFSSEMTGGKKFSLPVLSKNEFDIYDFLNEYVSFYNDKKKGEDGKLLSQSINRDARYIREVVKIDA